MSQDNKTLSELLTPSGLRAAAGSRLYLRGEEYYANGAVHDMHYDGSQLTAEVVGTHVYRTVITAFNGEMEGHCSCPMGRDGCFCKHLVALGLKYLNEDKMEKKSKSSFDWAEFLKSCEREELIKIILEMSHNNTEIIERYRMMNLSALGSAKLAELKRKVDGLCGLAEMLEEDYGEYDPNDSWEGVDNETDFLEQQALLVKVLNNLVKNGEMQLLWEVTTYALDRFLKISTLPYEAVQDFADKMMGLFMKAVHAKIKTDEAVFEQFSAWEKYRANCGCEIFINHWDKLPKHAKDLWIAKALEVWRKYPRCKLGEYQRYDSERQYIETLLLRWTDKSKDDSLKLQILEKRVASANDVLNLAKEYRRQGRVDKIIPLLQQAYKELKYKEDISDLLTEELLLAGMGQQALDFAWKEFAENYIEDVALDRLQKAAVQLKCWPVYYQKVLGFLEELDKKMQKTKSSGYYEDVRQRRVEVCFQYGDEEKAWELSKGAILSREWWLKLAEWRAKTEPFEAAIVLRKIVEESLIPTGEGAYQTAVDMLELFGKYMTMAGKQKEFADYCQQLRTEYKRRRLLLVQMDRAKL